VLRGMYAQAIPELEQAIALSGQSPRAIAELGLAYALSGNRRAALTQLEALQWQSTQRYVSPFNMAVIDAALDDKTQTFTCLQRAYEERSPSLSTLLMNPAFARIRTDHRFIALVRGIGLRS
jgi:tetratricopeptide (TPR) repeat protein